jgi:serine/threonine protein kinase
MERGIKTAEVIAALKETLWGPFYRSYLVSLELPGCIDLRSYLDLLKERTLQQRFRAKAGIFEAVARAFTAMHRSGIYHRDLHLKNVLLREGNAHKAPEVYIIDFDRAVLKAKLRPGEKLNNLMRFNRSIEKYRVVSGTVTRGDQMKLCRAYLAENGDTARLLPRAVQRYRVTTSLRRLKWGFRARTTAGESEDASTLQ